MNKEEKKGDRRSETIDITPIAFQELHLEKSIGIALKD